jgi:hypothetical protein
MGKRIIVTADDFGRSVENNEGVLAGYRAGVLTNASLMVAEPYFCEASTIAWQNPGLAVGVHICLSDGTPLSSPSEIPLLVGSDGRFPNNEQMLHAAVLSRAGRAQVRREVAAQFRTFFETGLVCDHVDVHRNSHMHPLVANEVFRAAASWHVPNIRIPYDPPIGRPRRLADPLRYGRVLVLRRLAASHEVTWLDRVIGRDWTDPVDLAALIIALPPGNTELFFHPVVCESDHPFRADLPALLDDRVRRALSDIKERINER